MKIKTAELTSIALDWAVAQIEQPRFLMADGGDISYRPFLAGPREYWRPGENWEQGGPIIEREKIECLPTPTQWSCNYRGGQGATLYWHGPTPLIAAMRCFVASKLGDEVDIPEELLS